MRTIRSLVHRLTTPICQKNGFVTAGILLDWSKILGSAFQEFCVAERVSFPPNKRSMGTLYVRTPSHMATEISYLEPTILEKINEYYGYQAISRLIIRQGPLNKAVGSSVKNSPPLTSLKQAEIEDAIAGVEDKEIKNALRQLGEGIVKKAIENKD